MKFGGKLAYGGSIVGGVKVEVWKLSSGRPGGVNVFVSVFFFGISVLVSGDFRSLSQHRVRLATGDGFTSSGKLFAVGDLVFFPSSMSTVVVDTVAS